MTSLALELRAERTRRRCSQERMAVAVGVSVRQYQRWEGGLSRPRRRERERLRALLEGPPAGFADELTQLQREVELLRAEVADLRVRLRVARARSAA
jgi:transcriptional regulator with XRE-family HTH domain